MLTLSAYIRENQFLASLFCFGKTYKKTQLVILFVNTVSVVPLQHEEKSEASQACWAYLQLLNYDYTIAVSKRSASMEANKTPQ